MVRKNPTAAPEQESTVTETTETTEKAPRVKRTPEQRATARVDAAAKKLAKAEKRRDRVAGQIDEAEKDVARAQRLLDFTMSDEDVPAGYTPQVGDEVEGDEPESTVSSGGEDEPEQHVEG